MSAIFVTATGTDVGKTFVTAGLVRRLRARGQRPAALKPLLSGYADDTASLEASDPGALLRALGRPVSVEEVARLSPWRYKAPLSPDQAAALEGESIDTDALVEFCRESIAFAGGPLLIEGVGGVMVPLAGRWTVLDWMQALDIPVLLVAGNYLGTLSHTLTALEALHGRGLRVAAVALNESVGATTDIAANVASLRAQAPDLPVLPLPRLGDTNAADLDAALDRLLDALPLGTTLGRNAV